ncbi:MAG: hypothetical protein K0R75_1657 [Paenibacillaceae bacterium]|nr:hypothetical protein [Paenibacillaceae bacterium]
MEKEKKAAKETHRKHESQVGVSGGKPLRVLSTSLGILLAANMLLMPEAADAAGESAANNADQPKLVEWSSDAVKAYFDPNVDWNIPYPVGSNTSGSAAAAGAGTAVANGTGGGNTTIIREGGGFGWDDLLLYHLIFNSGRSYSTSAWDSSRPVMDNRTNQPYSPKSFDSETFRNQPTAGSTVRPTTSSKSGTFTTRSKASSSTSSSTATKPSSSSPGSIGGKSSGFSSSTSHSSGISFGG